MSFEPKNLAVTLKTVTIRNEKHGDDDVTAISMGLRATLANTELDALDATLRHALYQAVPGQEQLPGVEPATPLLRTKSIETLPLKQCFEGWTLEIDHGIDEADPIKLGGCKVDKFVLTPHEGGSVDLAFRIGSNDIDAHEIGLIGAKLAGEISISLTAPVKTEGPAIDGSRGHPGLADSMAADDKRQGDLLTPEGALAASVGDDAGGPEDDAEGEGSDPDAAQFEAAAADAIAKAGMKPKRGGARA